ncbi:MAG: hypothetical protein K5790_05380 [Nitrosopumilus sp.]|nr:hypothetical protein [Nitrosopumilus sp.]MCV0392711.1 hypothetical protein [Nitrosopumilus sp.]
MINKKITKSDLAVVASVIFFSSVLFGNNVSFGDTTQPPSKAQIAKQQA